MSGFFKNQSYSLKMNTEKIHIAYADDHIAVREGITKLITDSGKISVDIQADNGHELIAKLEKADMLPSVCILDINMPVKDGFATQAELIQRWPDIRTLVLTVYEQEYFIIKMVLAGARGYLLKRCLPSEIEKAVISIHRNGIYHSDFLDDEKMEAIKQHPVKLSRFTAREMDVLRYCCTCMEYTEIGAKLGISKRSVEGHRDNLFRKLKVNSRIALVLCAIQSGLVPIEIKTDNLIN